MPGLLLVLVAGALACASDGGILVRSAVKGSVIGQVPDPDANPAVVYLVPLAGETFASEPVTRTLAQDEQHAWPALAAVGAGDGVVFRGHGSVQHRVFSYSETNAFDVRVPSPGASDPVVLDQEGPVRFYCSLHPWESGLVFVAPTPWFSLVDAEGNYQIDEVPAGRYRLRSFGEGGVELDEVVLVDGEETLIGGAPLPSRETQAEDAPVPANASP